MNRGNTEMDAEITDLFLTGILNYGASMLAIFLLLGGMGIPLPGTLMVLLAGAMIRQGMVELAPTLSLALLGVVIGDSLSFAMGYYARERVTKRFGQSAAWSDAQNTFKKYGGVAIYFTRFLVTPLAIPTNLIAGSSGYAYHRFLVYILTGEITWLLLFGGLGYTFGTQLEVVNQFISDFSGFIVGIIALFATAYLWKRRYHRDR